ncbi:MAG TPA: hypothetical protein VIP46_12950 [Pyrinomonadaceae bacterium]
MTRPRKAAARDFGPRRVLLLAEIARRCRACDAQARVGLTKEEARAYHGFECARCEAWNEDGLTGRDIPDWWEELKS